MMWSGLLCGGILIGCHGLFSAVAVNAPGAGAGSSASNAPTDIEPVVLPDQEPVEESAFPYAVIMHQNPFRLNPPPPPPAAPAPPPPDLPTVILSGTRTTDSKTVAMFAVKVKKTAKDPETTTYLSLTEGQTEGPVELLKIAPGGDEVTILNSGTRQVLNMKDNGFGSKGASPAAGPPGLIKNNPASPAPGSPIPMAAAPAQGPVTTIGNVGRNAGGGTSSRFSGDPIIGGAAEPGRATTTTSAAVVTSAGTGGTSSSGSSGLIIAGATITPTTTTTVLNSGTTTNIGGTPPNTSYSGPVQQPAGIPTPPMPSLPTRR